MKNKFFILGVIMFSVLSCTDASQAKIGAFGDKFEIDLVNCDGTVTHSWVSTGKVGNNKDSDGYYFNDEKTGTLIEVSGNVIIRRIQSK